MQDVGEAVYHLQYIFTSAACQCDVNWQKAENLRVATKFWYLQTVREAPLWQTVWDRGQT